MRTASSLSLGALVTALGLAGAAGCANDPEYMQAPMAIEAGMADPMNQGKLIQGKASFSLPIKPETAADKKTRDALAKKLAPVTVPYVKVGDLEVEIEWQVTNLDATDGNALIEINGANEYFSYDPSIIKLDPGDDEAPPTPGLGGDIPIPVPAMGTASGVFTEDNLRESSIDLDGITRGNISPFNASLLVNKNEVSFQPQTAPMFVMNPDPDADDQEMLAPATPVGPPVPREAFAYLTRIDFVFKPDSHMTLTYNVRVRDIRGILADKLLDTPANQLAKFMPMLYNPTPATTPAP